MIGLTLEGGGTRGSYQIGAYYALRDCHIKINGVNGTSIGSFNAAMIAAHQEKELLAFWQNVNMAKLLDLEGFKDVKVTTLNKTFDNIKSIIKNKGIDTALMKSTLDNIIDLDRLYASKIDYGLVTVRLKHLSPVYKYKKDISKSKLTEYIIGSCCLPVFKMEKIIDSNYYIDGGFYDNCPVNMWIKKGYKKIYVISLKGPGLKAKYDKNAAEIVWIKPSRSLGSILSLKEEKINDNIRLGYFDTLKVVKNLDGNKYCFKKKSESFYNFITRKLTDKDIKKLKVLFSFNNNKEMVIKLIELIMKENKYTYYKVYNPLKIIRELKCINNNSLAYKCVRKIKFLR